MDERVLRAVEDGEAAPAAEAPSDRRRWIGVGLLALVFVAVVAAYAVERQRAGALAAEVATLEGQLATARAEVQAHELRMAEVNAAVQTLADRIGELQSLVGQPVEALPAAAPESTTP